MINFVGAGPGAADLITVRGKNLIEQADVIIYSGSLVNEEILNYADKENCEIYNSASMTLEETAEIMLKAESDKKNIVRLHTGDPCVYGAIKEQMDILDEYGVKYEVCPGVSSFCAAAATLKAEYTQPEISQSVIITRLEGKTPVPPKEDITLFAAHNSTMVIFLSAGMLDELSKRLIKGGYKEDTPAAIVYKASWREEKVIRTTVKNLFKSAAENGIKNTALITVGNFLGGSKTRSKLYDPSFSHSFREGV